MRRYLLFLVVMMAAASVHGATILASLGHQEEATINYQSIDVNGNPVTLSAKLYYYKTVSWFKTVYSADFVVLNCHPTISHNNGCPTGKDPQLEAVKYMTTEKALVVCPDYLGFGASSDRVHPYMCADITARNVLDCYKAAIEYAKKKGIQLASNLYTINVGYSQGGAVALAFQKYLETEASAADRALVNLRGSLCGAGPYDQQIVFDTYESMSELSYPAYLPYAISGIKECFGDSHMKNITIEQCFTDKFNKSGFMAKLAAKETTIDDLNTLLLNQGFKTFYDIISPDYADRKSAVYCAITGALAESNLLDGSWMPEAPVTFYHYDLDEVVPAAETTAAMAAFEGCSVKKLTQADYSISDNRWWDLAFSVGGYSRELCHRNCGVYFYLMFLSGNMRPEAAVRGSRNAVMEYNTSPASTGIQLETEPSVVAIYGLNGEVRTEMQPGVNILQMSDGTSRKVVK